MTFYSEEGAFSNATGAAFEDTISSKFSPLHSSQ